MLCGNAFNAICTTILGGCSITALWALIVAYSEVYLQTFSGPSLSLEDVCWLSPLVQTLYILVWTAPGVMSGHITYWILSILMIVIMLVAAYLLYRKRPSELAERGIENKPVQHFLRIIVSLICGLALAMIFIFIVDPQATGWILFGAILGTFMAFGFLNIIFHMDFRAFFKYKWEMILTIVVTCLVFPVFQYDLTGYNKRFPLQENILEVSYNIYNFYEDYNNEQTISYDDTSDLYQLLQVLTDEDHLNIESDYTVPINIEITMKNGRKFSRTYRYQESDLELLRPLIEDKKYLNAYYPHSMGLMGIPSDMTLEPVSSRISYNDLTEAQKKRIMDAYHKDFVEHNTLEELASYISVCDIVARYNMEDSYENRNAYYMQTQRLPVYDTYTATIAAIEECFPGCALTFDKMDIESLEFVPETNPSLPKDSLYSYFGLEGYPDYKTYQNEYTSTDLPAAVAETVPYEYVPYEYQKRYYLAVDNSNEIAKIIPFLHFGNRRFNYLPSLRDQYIYLGQIRLTDGYPLACYVKSGELPKEWIDKMSLTEVSEIPAYSYY